MTDEEAMEALLNSDGYSFPTWTLKLGLPTDEMRLVMSLIASDKAPIPVDVAYISEYLHMDGAVVESSVKELLDRRLVYKKDSYLILDLEMCDHIFDAAATVRQAKVNSDIDEAFCPPIPLVAMRAGEIYSDSSLASRLVLGFISAWSFAADFCPYCPHDIAKLLGLYDSDVEDAIAFWSDMVYCRNVKRTGERNPNMSQTIDTPSYTIELSDGSIRPMTVKELAIRLEQLMSADKGIAEMPVGLSVDSEGNGVYVPRVFVPKEAGGDNPMDNVVGVIAEEDCAYYGVPACVLIG